MGLRDFKVISFACSGTLIDRNAGVHHALQPLLEAGRVTLSREAVLARFEVLEAEQTAATTALPYSAILREVHRSLAREWGVVASEDMHELFGRSVPLWPVYADAPAALQYLTRYFRIVVLSNIDRESFAASIRRRLEVKFDAVYTADQIGAYKPSLRNFQQMIGGLAKLGVRESDILHTAQSLRRDHLPAARCGLATAWIDRDADHGSAAESLDIPLPPARTLEAGTSFRFKSIVHLVKAHSEHL